MQITRAGEYAVLGLMALARRPLGEVVMLDVVAREEDVPVSFLGKIFQSLSKSGLVRSTRGTGGGFALEKAPAEITVLAVVEAIEGPISLQRCLDESSGCEHSGSCALCGLLSEAQDRVKEVFARTTITQLASRHIPAGLVRQARASSVGLSVASAPAAAAPEPIGTVINENEPSSVP